MSEYWKSTPRHYCQICNTWISAHPRNIAMHERSERHCSNKDAAMRNMEKQKREEKEAAHSLQVELHQIETAARAAMEASIASSTAGPPVVSPLWHPEYASRFVPQPPPPRTEEERLRRPLEELNIAKYIAEATGRRVEVQSTVTHAAEADKTLLYYPDIQAIPGVIQSSPTFNDSSLWTETTDQATELPVWINRALGIALWEQPPAYVTQLRTDKKRRTAEPSGGGQAMGMSTIVAVPSPATKVAPGALVPPAPPPSMQSVAARITPAVITVSRQKPIPSTFVSSAFPLMPPSEMPQLQAVQQPSPSGQPPLPPAEAPLLPVEAPPPPAEIPPPPMEAPPPPHEAPPDEGAPEADGSAAGSEVLRGKHQKVLTAPMPGKWIPVRPDESVFSRGTMTIEELEKKERGEIDDGKASQRGMLTAAKLDDFLSTTNVRADRVLGFGDTLDAADLEVEARTAPEKSLPSSPPEEGGSVGRAPASSSIRSATDASRPSGGGLFRKRKIPIMATTAIAAATTAEVKHEPT